MNTQEIKSRKAEFIKAMQLKILSGDLKPGDRVPPERELAQSFGISRGSVSQGILDLERAGFLRIVPRKGTFVAEYVRNASPETLGAIMSFDSTYIDSSLFSDLMDLRILVERECVRLACAKLSPGKLDTLRRRTDAIYAADEEHMTDALYAYHKCLTEISGNAAYSMVFQSFEVMLHNLIQEHYKNRAELQKALPKFVYLTEAIARRDAFEADRQLLSVLSQASDYINAYLRNRSTSKI